MKASRTQSLPMSNSANVLNYAIAIRLTLTVIFFVCFLPVILLGQEQPSEEQQPAEELGPKLESSVDFDEDILPLLSDRCFQCHGPDEAARESGLRLDTKEGAFGAGDSGEAAIVPGDTSASTLYQRIVSDDQDLLMPPPESGLRLQPEEREKLRAWIAQGADWKQHWAFIKPTKPSLPETPSELKANQPIDRFILHQVVQANLAPNPTADKETLIRRATLDLTGLPPTINEIDEFLADQSPNAYEKVIDRLLKSPRYGEHMGRIWLDAARYADTHGLHLDNERQIWPYRDWVIQAFNQNMPFDQFTVEQIAGDLLPTPTLTQRVATGFNRCNVTTSEGGSIDDEYYVRYAVDRVETTSTVWLGLTAGCAACHDHKFDPLTQKEFYQLFSYFYSLTEKAMDGNALLPPPAVKVPSKEQSDEQARLTQLVTETTNALKTNVDAIQYVDPTPTPSDLAFDRADSVWFDDELPEGAKPQGDGPTPWQFVEAPDHPVYSGKNASFRTGTGLNQHFFTEASSPLVIGDNDSLFAYVYLDPENPPETVQLQFNNGSWEHRAFWGADKGHGAGRNNPSNLRMGDLPEVGKWVRLEVPASSVDLQPGTKINGWAFTQFGGTVHWDHAGVVTVAPLTEEQLASQAVWEQYQKEFNKPAISEELKKIIDLKISERTEEQAKKLREHYLKQVNPTTKKELSGVITKLDELQKQLDAVNQSIPSTLVMEERPEPRQAYILERGEYTQQRDPVSPATPQWLGPQPTESSNNRLGLAKWLVSPENPLTSRVIVNRFWQHFFGTWLVKTSEDFGVQGERPSHPELLDWLAVEFIESGWNVQALQKQILLSNTYQQQSTVSEQHLRVDPENRLLARGPRFRLDAEIIRDQALFVSGLMHGDIGGPSVKPYQPAGLWKPVGFGGSNTSVFTQDSGEKLYRRSMYTFWKRTSPPPSMTTFDAPDRETCQVRRARTNTPLQALVLLNDVQFIEAARKFAEKVHREGGNNEIERLTFAFRSTVGRMPSDAEIARLTSHLEDYLQHFQASPEAATELLSVGESPADANLEAKSVAAWTLISHLLLNLSETITRG
ncbi:MAG: PSD1 and planctomycete cytochrome C domain-containing protein [Rubripirellula sp.]|nr:PSD1 and planctomycete cytochrome C domain-containing protein [Rubripirellula sp.]